jgi:hypothetical protein
MKLEKKKRSHGKKMNLLDEEIAGHNSLVQLKLLMRELFLLLKSRPNNSDERKSMASSSCGKGAEGTGEGEEDGCESCSTAASSG